MILTFIFALSATTLFAAGTFDLTIPLPLTGKPAKFGEIMKRSYEMAAEEINAKGGVKGKMITLSFEDSNGKPEIARSIVEKLIDSKKQPVIVGEYTSSCAKAVAAVAEEQTLAIADRAYVLENGRVVMQGTGQALLSDEHVKTAYLGV
jgi:branched-chain amino acid transport system substrate-binding protein